VVLGLLAAVMAISVPLWVRTFTGWLVVPALAVVVGFVALRGGPVVRTVFAQFIGLLLSLDTVTRIDYLFVGSAVIAGEERRSDVGLIADAIGLHHLIWGSLLAVISFALLAIGARLAWARPLRLRRSGKTQVAPAKERPR
jgi:hypothetical protein